jgi:pimeloyl-ACP methyl ester carboxylesterase
VGLAYERVGSGPPLVLLHGVGHRRQAWEPVAGLLAGERELILVDLPGHGESPPLQADGRPPVEVMSETVLGLFDELGLDQPHVAGNSLGGLLALQAGVARRAASVTALSPAGFFRGRRDVVSARAIFAIMRKTGRVLQPATPILDRSTTGRGVLFSAVVHRPGLLTAERASGDIAAFRAADDAVGQVLGSEVAFSGLAMPDDLPVTIAWGAHDRLLPRRQALVARKQVPGAHFVLLPGCGHVPMTDNPKMVAGVLLRGSGG